MPQASDEYGPICHYYVVVVPDSSEIININPDKLLNQKVKSTEKKIVINPCK